MKRGNKMRLTTILDKGTNRIEALMKLEAKEKELRNSGWKPCDTVYIIANTNGSYIAQLVMTK